LPEVVAVFAFVVKDELPRCEDGGDNVSNSSVLNLVLFFCKILQESWKFDQLNQ